MARQGRSLLKLRHLLQFNYAGIPYDFAYLVDRRSGTPHHLTCGFALHSAISGKHRTLQSSIAIIEQLKLFFEELVLFNQLDWRDVSSEQILQYLHEYRYKAKGLSGRSINLQRHAIESFYDWAYQLGFIDTPKELEIEFQIDGFKDHIENPDPHTAIESQYISQQEFEVLLANVPGRTRYMKLRNELVMLLGYMCGTRTHELTHQHNFVVAELLDKLDLANNTDRRSFEVTVYGKGNNKARNVLVTPRLFQSLKNFLTDPRLRARFDTNSPLFLNQLGKPITGTNLGSQVFRKALANCPEFVSHQWQRRSFHSLRHSFATNLATWCAETGYDWRSHVPARLGHSHHSTSLIYVEVEALMNNRVKLLNELRPTKPTFRKGRR